MIEALAEKLAARIKNVNEEETASVAVMKFALIYVINFVIPFIASLMIGAFSGKWAETLLTISVFVPIRMISGGYHFNSPIPCILVTSAVMTIPAHVVISDNWIILLTSGSLAIFVLLAPANMKGYNTMPDKYYPLLKAVSVLIVASNFLIQSPALALVFAIQGGSLLFKNKEVNES